MRKLIFICDNCKNESERNIPHGVIHYEFGSVVERSILNPIYIKNYGEVCEDCSWKIGKYLSDNKEFFKK